MDAAKKQDLLDKHAENTTQWIQLKNKKCLRNANKNTIAIRKCGIMY